jgi:hypothetical protein
MRATFHFQPELHNTLCRVKKKKGVTRVAHAATLQLNPAMEGYSQYEKGNHQDKPHP